MPYRQADQVAPRYSIPGLVGAPSTHRGNPKRLRTRRQAQGTHNPTFLLKTEPTTQAVLPQTDST